MSWLVTVCVGLTWCHVVVTDIFCICLRCTWINVLRSLCISFIWLHCRIIISITRHSIEYCMSILIMQRCNLIRVIRVDVKLRLIKCIRLQRRVISLVLYTATAKRTVTRRRNLRVTVRSVLHVDTHLPGSFFSQTCIDNNKVKINCNHTL